MDLEDDTTVLTTLKSFNSFISRTEPQQRLTERPGSGTLQGQYKRSMEVCVSLHHQWSGTVLLCIQCLVVYLHPHYCFKPIVVGGCR